MASAAPATSSNKETTNYARLCRLLVDVGTQALRDTLDAIHTPTTLHAVLAANKPTLQGLRFKRIINATQWGKLSFSNSLFAVRVNLLHPEPSLFLYGLLLSL